MTRILPQNTDTLNNPSHSFLHRVISVDTSSPESSIDVDASGNVFNSGNIYIGSTTAGKNLTTYATLGTELFTGFVYAGNWIASAGWDLTNDSGTQLVRNDNGIFSMSHIGFAPTIGVTYKLVFVVNELTVGSGTWTFGGVSGTSFATATTVTEYIKAATTSSFIFTPVTSATRFKINSISIKAITNTTGDINVYGDVMLCGTLRNINGNGVASVDPSGAMRIPNIMGKVAIGKTTAAAYDLDVVGTSYVSGFTYFGAGTMYVNPAAFTMRLNRFLMVGGNDPAIYSADGYSMYIYSIGQNETKFGTNSLERARFHATTGDFFIGTTDTDGTPAVGRLTVKGSTNDGTTNILVGRDSDEANVFSVDTNGVILGSQYRLSALNTAPANATDTGTLGEIRVVADYIYVCTATNTWVRSVLTTW